MGQEMEAPLSPTSRFSSANWSLLPASFQQSALQGRALSLPVIVLPSRWQEMRLGPSKGQGSGKSISGND